MITLNLKSETVKIRRVTRFSKRVFSSILKLLPQLDPAYTLPTRQEFETILTNQNNYFFLAELENKEIAGMLTLVSYKTPTGTKYWIEDVVVDESYRGKGVGKGLMRFAIDFARSKGAKSIDLTSRPFRIEANKLYKDMGFILRETNVYRYII